MGRAGEGNDKLPTVMTGFDVERILRQGGAPKGFAKAAAAACRAAGLFDRCHADEYPEIESVKEYIKLLISNTKRSLT